MESRRTNTLAIVGFIFAFIMPLVGLICSIIGRRQCAENDEDGSGLALAGIVISSLWLVAVVIIVFAVFGSMCVALGSMDV